MITAIRYHDFSCGHRVVGHESKCALLHGHNYRVHFEVTAPLDGVGRVMDFSTIKQVLCDWLEMNWDHKFLAWDQDPVIKALMEEPQHNSVNRILRESIVWVPFNPTAEYMATYLLLTVGPRQLEGSKVKLISVVVEETRKCSATANL
jgi:6-pyruvoyltetrahydropterin/6-carboxytetrahydropterin synthase